MSFRAEWLLLSTVAHAWLGLTVLQFPGRVLHNSLLLCLMCPDMHVRYHSQSPNMHVRHCSMSPNVHARHCSQSLDVHARHYSQIPDVHARHCNQSPDMHVRYYSQSPDMHVRHCNQSSILWIHSSWPSMCYCGLSLWGWPCVSCILVILHIVMTKYMTRSTLRAGLRCLPGWGHHPSWWGRHGRITKSLLHGLLHHQRIVKQWLRLGPLAPPDHPVSSIQASC